jgi:hypothetical protein
MYIEVSQSQFVDEFKSSSRADSFSVQGLCALYDFLSDTDQSVELDIIAIDCDFVEYSSFEELQEEYASYELTCIEDVYDYTSVIEFDGGIIIQAFKTF